MTRPNIGKGRPARRARPAPTSVPLRTDRDRPLILVVDDVSDSREMYAEFLQFSGYRVLEAAGGGAAIDLALMHQPSAIVMDISMPGMDGIEATERLKKDPRTATIPIIAITGFAIGGAVEAAKAVGCDLALVKPCLPEKLLTYLRRYVKAA